jgi:hypothetical protein
MVDNFERTFGDFVLSAPGKSRPGWWLFKTLEHFGLTLVERWYRRHEFRRWQVPLLRQWQGDQGGHRCCKNAAEITVLVSKKMRNALANQSISDFKQAPIAISPALVIKVKVLSVTS